LVYHYKISAANGCTGTLFDNHQKLNNLLVLNGATDSNISNTKSPLPPQPKTTKTKKSSGQNSAGDQNSGQQGLKVVKAKRPYRKNLNGY